MTTSRDGTRAMGLGWIHRLCWSVMAVGLTLPSFGRTEPAVARTVVVTIAGSQANRDVADLRAALLVEALGDPAPMTAPASREALLRAVGRRGLRRAAALTRSAHAALDAFDNLEGTSRELRRAALAQVAILPLLDTLDEPVRLFVGLATVEVALGRENEVHRALVAALRLDPALDLDPQEVSPRLVRALRRARTLTSDQPLLEPDQARSLARRVGADRLIVVQPRPGPRQTLVEHYLASSGVRVHPWLISGTNLGPVATALRESDDEGPPTEAPAPVASAVPGDTDSPVRASTPADNQDDVENAEGAPHLFGDDSREGQVSSPRRPWYRRWWLWTLVGVIVAGGTATGVVFGLQASQESGDLSLEIRAHW